MTTPTTGLFHDIDDIFQRIVESAVEGVWITNEEGQTLFANPQMLAMLGTTSEELAAHNALDFILPEDHARAQEQLVGKPLNEGAPPVEIRLRRADGRVVWARVASRILNDNQGHRIGMVGIFFDISEQRATAATLALTEDQLRLAVEAAALGIFNSAYPLDEKLWTASEEAPEPADLLNHSFEYFVRSIHPADRAQVRHAIENSARHHAMLDVEHRTTLRPAKLGDPPRIKWIRAIGRHTYDGAGNPIRLDGVTMDVTNRKLLEQALREESLTTQTLYALSKTLITEFDNEILVQSVTDAARLLTGAAIGAFFYNVTDAQGDAYMLYTISGADRSAFEKFSMPRATKLFGPTFKGEGPIRIDDIFADPRYGKNAPYFGLPKGHPPVRSYLAAPVVSRFGHVIGGLFYGHPEPGKFSERDERTLVGIASHAAIALDNARLLNEARQASAAKDQFLAVLSHELRTPLNPVLLTASMMANDAALPEEVRKNARVIRRNVELEARLIDDMLDLTRIAKGKLEIQPVVTDVHEQIRHVADMFDTDIHAKHLSLSLDLTAHHHYVSGDPARLQQVWWNLLRNAIKFTDDGGQITIRTRDVEESPQPRLAVDVIDTGIGIEPDQLQRLFRAFEQADQTVSRRYGGLGLGLSISRSLVEIHHGTITAKSDGTGKGATFTTELPAVPTPVQPLDSCQIPPPASAVHLHILLVEDHLDTATTMARLLTAMGHKVTVAHTVHAAIEQATSHRFDVLLCDIGLPDGSGMDVLSHIPKEGRPPAIALTGYGMEEDVQRSLDAGFADHLTKPVDFDRLLHVLYSLHPADQPAGA